MTCQGTASLLRFLLRLQPSQSRSLRVGDDIDPLRVWRRLRVVVIVPVPPLVRRSLRVTRRRVLPCFLPSQSRHVEVAPRTPQRLVPAAVDEVSAEHFLSVANERVRPVPLIHAEVFIEAVRDGV